MRDDMLNVAALEIAKAFGVPMNLLDGRPWVPTAEEADARVESWIPAQRGSWRPTGRAW